MKKALKIIGIVLLLLVVGVGVFLKVEKIYPIGIGAHDEILNEGGIAIGENDVVSYFQGDAPLEGVEEFSTEYKGATWLFSSKENLNLFAASPEKYEPLCGGHCLFAASTGFAVPSNLSFWKIHEGRLVFFSAEDVLEKSEKDMDKVIQDAEQAWK